MNNSSPVDARIRDRGEHVAEHLSAFIIFARGRGREEKNGETSRLIESDTMSENNRCPLVARVLDKESLRVPRRFHGKPFVVLEALEGEETTGGSRRRVHRSKLFTNSVHPFRPPC